MQNLNLALGFPEAEGNKNKWQNWISIAHILSLALLQGPYSCIVSTEAYLAVAGDRLVRAPIAPIGSK